MGKVIAFRNAVNAPGSTASVTSFATNVPTFVNGDFLLWILESNNANVAPTPSGWAVFYTTTTTGLSLSTFWRIAENEPGSYTASSLTSARWGGSMLSFSGVDQVNPIDVAAPTASKGTTTLAFPAITPVTPGAMILALASETGPSGTTNVNWSAGNMDAVVGDSGSNVSAAVNAFGMVAREAWSSGAFTPTPSDDVVTARTIGQSMALRPARDVGWGAAA